MHENLKISGIPHSLAVRNPVLCIDNVQNVPKPDFLKKPPKWSTPRFFDFRHKRKIFFLESRTLDTSTGCSKSLPPLPEPKVGRPQ